jgi:hypothetical protein
MLQPTTHRVVGWSPIDQRKSPHVAGFFFGG